MSEAPPHLLTAEARRVRQSADTHAEPEVLQALASDCSITVRATLALNPASPAAVNQKLSQDPDERVRMLLARRLAGLLPDLTAPDQARLQRQTYETLARLVADTAVRVRAVIADVLKDMPQAPRALVLQLAQDRAVMVAAPIIRFSPLLTSEDLIGLIAAAQSPATVVAVAGRPGIDTRVSDAIAATADNAAIRALLANRTAQIREATLDVLIAQAREHPDWHEPLVHRPNLSPRTARALAEIVATNLVDVLAARTDLPARLAEDLRQRLTERLNAESPPRPHGDPTMEEAMAAAHAAANAGTLNEDAVLAATRDGTVSLASALLAVAAGVPVSVVERAASLRSTKGLASLAWKAGFSMRAAGALQTLLGHLGPDAVLLPGPGNSFPLAIEEMRWQLDFLERMGR
ncbi:MAG TPA: DUF2336 domain-containing protein [Acetobacteraceae bacterium]|nr:DUF2336 domain-containing protein [Acetobacteraceae bacterium]